MEHPEEGMHVCFKRFDPSNVSVAVIQVTSRLGTSHGPWEPRKPNFSVLNQHPENDAV